MRRRGGVLERPGGRWAFYRSRRPTPVWLPRTARLLPPPVTVPSPVTVLPPVTVPPPVAVDGEHRAPASAGHTAVAVLDLISMAWLLVIAALAAWAMLPILWGWTPVLITSGSMQPTIRP